jgi:hypothetical protein
MNALLPLLALACLTNSSRSSMQSDFNTVLCLLVCLRSFLLPLLQGK